MKPLPIQTDALVGSRASRAIGVTIGRGAEGITVDAGSPIRKIAGDLLLGALA